MAIWHEHQCDPTLDGNFCCGNEGCLALYDYKCRNLFCKQMVEHEGEECLGCEKLNDERGDE